MNNNPTRSLSFGWQKFLSWLAWAVPTGIIIALMLQIPSPLKDVVLGVMGLPAFVILMTGLLIAQVGEQRYYYRVFDGEETKEIWSPQSARQLELARLNRPHQEAHPRHRQYASAILATQSGFKVVMVEFRYRGREWPILWRIYTANVLNEHTKRFSANEETKALVMRDSLNQLAHKLESEEIEVHYPARQSAREAERQAWSEKLNRERELARRATALNAG